jgi:hypothetical protein
MSGSHRLVVAALVGALASGLPVCLIVAYSRSGPMPRAAELVSQVLMIPGGVASMPVTAPHGSDPVLFLAVIGLANLLFYTAFVWALLGKPWRWFRRRFSR